MSFSRPINLGQAQTTIGGATAIDPRVAALLAAGKQQGAPQEASAAPQDRMYAVAQALSQTPRVEGTNPLEAVAAALTGGLRGRLARREHDDEEKQTARQNQWADVLQQHQLGEWKQQDADRQTAQQTQQQHADALSTLPEELRPYAVLGIEGPITQYARHEWPTPQRPRAGAGGAPDLPAGFQWAD